MLKGKVAVVTGASRGIGAAIAKKLAASQATVIINYQGNKARAEEVQKEIEDHGGIAAIYQCDVSDLAACEAFFAWVIQEYGRIDILVNNAGITRDGLLMAMSEEDFDQVLDINLKGTFHCMKLVSRQMMRQRAGKIINMSSYSGVCGNPGQANYSASNAGVIGLTMSAAKELAKKGICVNAIAPGFIETEMTDVLPDAVKSKALENIPMGRFGSVDDIANAVLFLAQDGSNYITGQVLRVDGGM